MAPQMILNTTQRLAQFPRQWRSGLNLWRSLGAIVLLTVMWGGYLFTGQPVTLVINGQPHQVRGRYPTVAIMMRELGLSLRAEDIVQPPAETKLSAGDVVTIQLARPVAIEVDGTTRQRRTHQQSVEGILAEAGNLVKMH